MHPVQMISVSIKCIYNFLNLHSMSSKNQIVFPPEVKAEHDVREKAVFKFLTDTTGELTSGFRTFENGSYILPERPNFILCFSFIDVIRKYWDIYSDIPSHETHQKPSFIRWLDTFCFTADNADFMKNKMLQKINSDALYKLRCSLVHFYGFSPDVEGITFSIAPNEASDKWVNETAIKLSKEGSDCCLLRSSDIHDLVFKGADLMLKKIMEKIDIDPQFHLDGIKRVYDKVQKEGAVGIELKLEDIK